MTDTIYGFPKQIHARAEHLIKEEVLACQTHLVETLYQAYTPNADSPPQPVISDYDLTNEYKPIPSQSLPELLAWWKEQDVPAPLTMDDLGSETEEEYLEDLLQAAREEIECLPQEVFEWWLVTPWLANKLEEMGEPVLEALGCTWWGRTTTGQQIILDGVFQRLVESMERSKS